MPPIEAMRLGVPTVTTRETSLYEVTQGKAIYVEDPLDPREWCARIEEAQSRPGRTYPFPEYDLRRVMSQYIDLFHQVGKA